jgi:hypothetical protein
MTRQHPLKVPTSAELIDELGDLERQLAVVVPLVKRAAFIRETIRGWMARRKPQSAGRFDGRRFVAVVTACQNQRSIKDLAGIFAHLGKGRFLELCQFTLKALEDNVPLPDRDKFIQETATGPRKVELAPLKPSSARHKKAA